MSNLKKYNEIFTRVLGVPESILDEQFTMDSVLQWDSVAHIALISELEDTFDILFDSEEVLHYESYENGKTILAKYGVIIK